MIKATPYAAFGYVVYITTADEGDTSILTLDKDLGFDGIYYVIKGTQDIFEISTGIQQKTRTPGWLNTEVGKTTSSQTQLKVLFHADSKWVCIHIDKNNNKLPTVSSLSVQAGNLSNIANGSNIYLCEGTGTINGQEVVAPYQLRVRSGDIGFSATTDCYLLEFIE